VRTSTKEKQQKGGKKKNRKRSPTKRKKTSGRKRRIDGGQGKKRSQGAPGVVAPNGQALKEGTKRRKLSKGWGMVFGRRGCRF